MTKLILQNVASSLINDLNFLGDAVNNERKAQCLKITEKVSFNIASEVSYVYILSGQKLIKNAKNGPF